MDLIRKIVLIVILATLVLVSPSFTAESLFGHIFLYGMSLVGLIIGWVLFLRG